MNDALKFVLLDLDNVTKQLDLEPFRTIQHMPITTVDLDEFIKDLEIFDDNIDFKNEIGYLMEIQNTTVAEIERSRKNLINAS